MNPDPTTLKPTVPSDSEIDLGQWLLTPTLESDEPGKAPPLANDVFDPVARREGSALPGVDLPAGVVETADR